MGSAGQSVTLANSIIGVGILAMPYCFQQCGILLASLILLLMGLVSRLCCYFLLKSALLARRRNYEFLAFYVFGPAGKLAVEVGIIGFLMGTCIAYFVVVGDLGPQIIAKMFNINQSDILRTSVMVIVSLVCVLPLGLLRNVDSLSNVSAATIGFYFCLVLKVITEAASQLLTSDWYHRVELWKPSGVLQCVPIFSMALFCQTQLFEIFESLPTLSLEKMCLVTKNAINICSCVYMTLGVFGYIAFCSQEISGNILMSLSPTMASDVIKLGFVMSLAFSFPLIIFPCRASLYSFLYKKAQAAHEAGMPARARRGLTGGIVCAALGAGLLLPNVELVLGLLGATVGALVCLVFPAACFVALTVKDTNERLLAKGVLVFGLFIMVLGTYANLQAAESKLDRYDEKYITKDRIDKMVEDFFEKRSKMEDAIIKPLDKHDNAFIPADTKIIKNNIVIDSEVQPPNPVPPESHSNEKNPINNIAVKDNNEDLLKEVLLPEGLKEAAEKEPESHPKDVQTKLNEARLLANGDSNKEIVAKPVEEVKPSPDNDKILIMKQRKLIETIKQHGEEQKKLFKYKQSEVLDEIIKANEELQKNIKAAKSNDAPKNPIAVDNIDAQKIAVESIKQIANLAIQSLGGASEKPVSNNDAKKSERLEKITNDAVQEIVKKAAETIEALQEIKENRDQSLNIPAKDENTNLTNIIPSNGGQKPVETVAKIEPEQKPLSQTNQTVQEIRNPETQQVVQNVNDIVNPKVEPSKNVPNANSQVNNVQPINENIQKVDTKTADVNLQNQQQTNEKQKEQSQVSDIVKPHLHSADEPQSYKEGEDTQLQNKEAKPKTIAHNVPIPLALNKNKAKQAAVESLQNNDELAAKSSNANVQNDGEIKKESFNLAAEANVVNNGETAQIRQKREAVDCKELTDMAEKIVCENTRSPELKKAQNYPKENLDHVRLPRSLPLDANAMLPHHISRSLKRYYEYENDKKR